MKNARILASSLLLLTAGYVSSHAAADIYTIDTGHSGVSFKVRHFLAKTPGKFTKFSGEIHYDEKDVSKSKAIATIKIGSIDTSNSKRDKHLKNEDYFDAGKYPTMTFESTAWKKVGKNKFEVTGNLTMLGISKPVTLDVDYIGKMAGTGHMSGTTISGWAAKTTIDRRDWGITSGAPAVGYEVDIEIDIEGHKKG